MPEYEYLSMPIKDLVKITKKFKGFDDGYYNDLLDEPGLRYLKVEGALVHFDWEPKSKTAYFINVIGDKDYESVASEKVWENVIERISKKHDVRFGRGHLRISGSRFMHKKHRGMSEDDNLESEMLKIIESQRDLDTAIENEVKRIFSKLKK